MCSSFPRPRSFGRCSRRPLVRHFCKRSPLPTPARPMEALPVFVLGIAKPCLVGIQPAPKRRLMHKQRASTPQYTGREAVSGIYASRVQKCGVRADIVRACMPCLETHVFRSGAWWIVVEGPWPACANAPWDVAQASMKCHVFGLCSCCAQDHATQSVVRRAYPCCRHERRACCLPVP